MGQHLLLLGMAVFTGILSGSASALLLVSLDAVTALREAHLWLIALLPPAGALVAVVYAKVGKGLERGSRLIVDEIHDPRAVIPLRMTPLVLAGTLISHLFGASVGREGTAVQMGASLGDQLTPLFKLRPEQRRILLMSGMSAGFASVFGTPWAGAAFGLEVLTPGRGRYEAALCCLSAAWVGDRIARAWGAHHALYAIGAFPGFSPALLLGCLVAGALFGIAARAFVELTHAISRALKARVQLAPVRALIGGGVVVAMAWALGSTRYLGLGIPVIVESFARAVSPADFAWKTLFTSVALGAGFVGGEVTPLFFIGATLGSALGRVLPVPFPVLAASGFVAVFGGAAKTPVASTLMAMELFGVPAGACAGLACLTSTLFSGRGSLYRPRT
jgi:H+/Cl- antiporter ClcA